MKVIDSVHAYFSFRHFVFSDPVLDIKLKLPHCWQHHNERMMASRRSTAQVVRDLMVGMKDLCSPDYKMLAILTLLVDFVAHGGVGNEILFY